MKAVLIDLDGTLPDCYATLAREAEGHVLQFDLTTAYAARIVTLDNFGSRPKREVMLLVVQELGLTHSAQSLLDNFTEHFMIASVPMPQAHAVVQGLRASGVRVGVVTNGWPEVQSADLSKPDPAIYRLALQRLG